MLEKIAVVSKLTAVAFVKFSILHLDLTPLTLSLLLLLLCWLFTGRLVHLCACYPPAGWASTGCVLSVDAVWTHDHQDQHTRRPIPAPHQCSNAPTATSLPYAAAPTCARWNHQSHSVLTLDWNWNLKAAAFMFVPQPFYLVCKLLCDDARLLHDCSKTANHWDTH